MTLWQYSAREIRSRPGRAALTLTSVVIGVAAVVAVAMSTITTRRAYKQMYQMLAGRAAVEVVNEIGTGFDASIADDLAEVEGVKAVVPILQKTVIVYTGEEETGKKRTQVLAMGIDPTYDSEVRDYKVVEGEFFNDDQLDANVALLEKGFANNLGIKVGDKTRILTKGGMKQLEVIGLLAAEGAAAFRQGAMFLPLPAAQRLLRTGNTVDAIQLVPTDATKSEELLAEVSSLLPPGLVARKPASRSQLSEETLLSTQQGLQLASALSVVVAAFIILNTFLMNVSERRRQLSILRAIGATRGQIRRLLLAEGLLLGVVGTLIGTAIGVGGASLLTHTMERLFQTALPNLQITPLPFVLGALLGLGVSLLATYLPAVWASRVSPLEGMRPISQQDVDGLSPWFTRLGIGLLVIAAGLTVVFVNGWWLYAMPTATAIVALIGCVMLIPATLQPLARSSTVALRPFMHIIADLAQRQLLRRRVRTTLTVAVLFVAIGAGTGLGTTIVNNVNDVKLWFDRTVIGDFFIRAMMPDVATGLAVDVPEAIGEEVTHIPGVTRVTSARFVSVEARGKGAILIVREFKPDDELGLDLRDSTPEEVKKGLLAGEVVIGTVLAKRTGLNTGDTIELSRSDSKRSFRICATANEYMVGGLALYMERGTAKEKLGIDGVDGFAIRCDKNLDKSGLAAVESQLREIAERDGLLLKSNAELRAVVDGMVNGVVGGLWVLLALTFVVAGFGIVNTLTMNVLEQTREIGLLRIVAMTRRQVGKLILAQAAILGMVGLLPGAIVGLGVAYLVSRSAQGEFGRSIDFSLHPVLSLGALGGAYAIVILAAWLPARRATRLQLSAALRYE